MATLDDYLPMRIDFKPNFHNNKLQKDLMFGSRLKEPILQLMKAAILCHQASKRKQPHKYSKSLYKSIYQSDEAQLMLAHSYGFNFISRQNKTVNISVLNTKERYDYMVIHTFSIFFQAISVIVIKPFQSSSN